MREQRANVVARIPHLIERVVGDEQTGTSDGLANGRRVAKEERATESGPARDIGDRVTSRRAVLQFGDVLADSGAGKGNHADEGSQSKGPRRDRFAGHRGTGSRAATPGRRKKEKSERETRIANRAEGVGKGRSSSQTRHAAFHAAMRDISQIRRGGPFQLTNAPADE